MSHEAAHSSGKPCSDPNRISDADVAARFRDVGHDGRGRRRGPYARPGDEF